MFLSPDRTWKRFSLSRRIGLFACSLFILLGCGCRFFVRSTPSPIPTRILQANKDKRASTLVVFLPGRGGKMEEFEANGFISTMRTAGIHADAVIVDAHLGYYLNHTVIDRLSADVLEPARRNGYRRIVLVGISMGGMGALLCERERPHAIDAIVLIAPYLGDNRDLFRQIKGAGGPVVWAAHRSLREGEVDEQIWTFLGTNVEKLPPTWVLTGGSDRLFEGQRMLAELLPADHVHVIDGTHHWKTWRSLWHYVCESAPVFADERR